ncbi:hypothetical protein Ade02nite_84350 [Paractinoplanes deccanensis]|uniref:DUF4173 domain-containing protein n=1 Tax=Paractinoplanes deccanensis TaxID=113561 RepID=A0ABQ3YIF7_9ACTN|nr:hypothetical protein [Actinoplanes deccanensis]GID79794.1 hypothetical protein Ade02nite_84350 [Actinoplanes deccanensis]
MTFLWDEAEEAPPKPRVTLRSRRGLLQAALSGAGWLLVIPLLRFTQRPPLLGSWLSLPLWVAGFLLAAAVSTIAIVVACARRSWGVALASLLLAAIGVVADTRLNSQVDYVDYQYREHRTELAALAGDYRAGRLDGRLTLPPGLRSLSPSGYAYAAPTALFIQMWQNARAESGTGLAYFTTPPTARTTINTADGDTGHPQRKVGDGWWWIA